MMTLPGILWFQDIQIGYSHTATDYRSDNSKDSFSFILSIKSIDLIPHTTHLFVIFDILKLKTLAFMKIL